jgi:hypothetical protein
MVHPLIEWAARSVVWGRLGVPARSSHATSMYQLPEEIDDAHKAWNARMRAMGVAQ